MTETKPMNQSGSFSFFWVLNGTLQECQNPCDFQTSQSSYSSSVTFGKLAQSAAPGRINSHLQRVFVCLFVSLLNV